MSQNEIVRRQLILRGLDSAYISKEVIGKNIPALFKGSDDLKMYALILATYYNKTSEPITVGVFKTKVEEYLTRHNTSNELSDDDLIKAFSEVDLLFESEADSSSEMAVAIDKYVRNALGSAAILKHASRVTEDPDYDIVGNTAKDLQSIDSLDITGQENKVISVYEDRDQVKKLYKELMLSKLPMGIQQMDMATDGGLAKGEVGLIAARSGAGKTTTLSSFSVSYARKGYNVLHISLEELKARMLLRFDRITAEQGVRQLLNHDNSVNEKKFDAITQMYRRALAKQQLGRLFFYRSSPQTVTVDRLQQIIVATEREHEVKFDVVILDYPDLLLNPDATGNESADGGHVFERLRKLAQENHVVLWTATQLNRTSASQEVLTLDSVEGSFRKKNTVEFAATLNRTDEEYENGFMRFFLDKNRNQDGFTENFLQFKYDPRTMNMTEETEAESQQHLDILQGNETDFKQSRKSAYEENHADERKVKEADKSAKLNQKFAESLALP